MQIATNALTPYAAETIGKTFGKNGSHPNEAAQLFSHALLAGIAAVGNGGHFGAGAAAGAGAEAAAKAITIGLYGEEAAANPNSLSEEQKANIRDLSAAVGALVGGIGGDSALNAQLGGVLGQNAVENNYLSLKDVNDLRAELRAAKTEEEKERIFEKYRKKGESKSQALRESCRGKGDECHLNAIAELRNTNQAAATIVNNGLLLSLTESGRTDLSAWGLALDSNLPDLSYHEGQLSGGAKLLDTGVKLSPVVVAAATAGGSKAAQAARTVKNTVKISEKIDIPATRPTAKQSEIDVGKDLPTNARAQVSFRDGKEVPYGTKGSVRPDWCLGNVCSIEVKNYDIHTNRTGLINIITEQATKRVQHLPKGMKQEIWIDVRGQKNSIKDRLDIQNRIYQKSNGVIKREDIKFLR